MWTPVRLRMTNFMSYKEFDYEFLKSKTTLIYGVNIDEPGADSNGSGKSTIVKGVTISLLDLPDKSIVKEDYIMDGEDYAELDFYLENPVHNKTLNIVRTIRRNKESIIAIIENGVENDQLTSVGECNKRILELIGINKEDILNYYIINQDNSHSFFESTDSLQKSTIARFANAESVDRALKTVQSDIQDKNNQIQSIQNKIANIDTKINTLNEQLEYEKTERFSDIEQEKKSIKENIVVCIGKIEKTDGVIKTYQESINEFNLKIDKLSLPDKQKQSKLEQSLSKNKTRRDEIYNSVKELRRELSSIDKMLSGEIKCPKCKYRWLANEGEFTIDELEKKHKEYSNMIDEVEKMSEKTENRIEELKSTLNHINTLFDEYDCLKQEISKYKRRIESSKTEIEEYRKQIELYNKKHKSLISHLSSGRVTVLEKEILECDEQKQELLQLINELNKEKEELTYWNINLGIKGFKTFLVNKILESVEGYVNLYLVKFKTNLVVRIQGFKTLKTGEVRENISVTISRDGGDTWKAFKRHSGGQRQRINVCGILTLQTMINNSSKYGGLDLLILDEFFEGLDQRGQHGVLKILNSTHITTLVISHNNNDIGAQHQLWVKYENEESKLVKDNEEVKLRENTKSQTNSASKTKIKKAA